MTDRAFGRKKRLFDPRIPHMSALAARRRALAPPPPAIDYLAQLPDDLGMMRNDSIGDCTAAGVYHARQLWSKIAAGREITEPDATIVSLYERFGYRPDDPATDQGAEEQTVLKSWMTEGIPVAGGTDKLFAAIELDVRNLDDVRRAIWQCGAVYIGFGVPQSLEDAAPSVWNYDPANARVNGGHCVVLGSFTPSDFGLISWGGKYRMALDFWAHFVDEAYALVDPEWIEATGLSPLGLTPAEIEAQMAPLRAAA